MWDGAVAVAPGHTTGGGSRGSAPRMWASPHADEAFGRSKVLAPACHRTWATCSSVERGQTVRRSDSLATTALLCALSQAVIPTPTMLTRRKRGGAAGDTGKATQLKHTRGEECVQL